MIAIESEFDKAAFEFWGELFSRAHHYLMLMYPYSKDIGNFLCTKS